MASIFSFRCHFRIKHPSTSSPRGVFVRDGCERRLKKNLKRPNGADFLGQRSAEGRAFRREGALRNQLYAAKWHFVIKRDGSAVKQKFRRASSADPQRPFCGTVFGLTGTVLEKSDDLKTMGSKLLVFGSKMGAGNKEEPNWMPHGSLRRQFELLY